MNVLNNLPGGQLIAYLTGYGVQVVPLCNHLRKGALK